MSKEFAVRHGQIAICSDRGFIKIKDNSGFVYCQQDVLVNLGLAITANLPSAAILGTQFGNMFETNFYTYIPRSFFSLSIFILIVVVLLRAKIEFVLNTKQNCQLKDLKWLQLILVCHRNTRHYATASQQLLAIVSINLEENLSRITASLKTLFKSQNLLSDVK